MKQKTLYILGGTISGLLLTYFGYSIWKAKKNKELAKEGKIIDSGGKVGTNDTNTQSSNAKKESRDSFPLQVGAFGYKVSLLQSALNKLGASLTIDGKFGDKTYLAINDNGGLPWYTWNSACEVGNICSLEKSDYEQILSNATKQGWKKEQAKDLAGETWKEFVQNGDDWVYNNLKI